MSIIDILNERGYTDRISHEKELREQLEKPTVFYIGFDATADSLTLGHFVQIMVMKRMQEAGHIPIALMGGGTTMIGDPSGRDDMRKLMTKDFINHNVECFKKQMKTLLDFSDDKAFFVNNADWLLDLNYLEFMRDVGRHFTINRMMSFDAYKNRLEDGLTFFEFGYLPLQSYDFLHLFREYDCVLQLGGSDQWANMISGADLIRRVEENPAYSMTFKLLTTATGEKMGKTGTGTIWLDPEKTSPYEMYQYLRNVDDRDVVTFLKQLTFTSMEEIEEIAKLEGSEINKGKELLAYSVVEIIHGKEEAKKAEEAARTMFTGGHNEEAPTTEMAKADFEEGIGLLNLLTQVRLTDSNGQARNLVKQGGVSVNDEQVTDFRRTITLDDFGQDGILTLRRGRRNYHQIKLK